MQDRRRASRIRSYLGARITYDRGQFSVDCLVRNQSPDGALVILSAAVMLPDAIDLFVLRTGTTRHARIVWRSGDRAGLAFLRNSLPDGVISLDRARRRRASPPDDPDPIAG